MSGTTWPTLFHYVLIGSRRVGRRSTNKLCHQGMENVQRLNQFVLQQRGAGIVSEPASQDKERATYLRRSKSLTPFLVNPFASHIHSAFLGQFNSEKTLARCEHPVWADTLTVDHDDWRENWPGG